MKALFLFQYFPYQYNQFKLLAEALEADVYYCNDLRIVGRRVSTDTIYDLNGNPLKISDIANMDYDYLIHTGPPKYYIENIAKLTKYHYTIYLSHSLMGTQYDVKIAMAPYDRSIGIMPKLWTSFDSFEHMKQVYRQDHKNWKFVESSSNPIVAEVLSYSPQVEKEEGTLGVILGEKSPFETSIRDIHANKDRLGIHKVYVKFHPLTEEENINLFRNDPLFEILPTDSHKYNFTDRCEYLVGGASSLLIESMIRNKYFSLGQKIMKLNIKRGVEINLPTLYTYGVDGKDYSSSIFDEMIYSPEEVVNEHLELIHFIEDNFI